MWFTLTISLGPVLPFYLSHNPLPFFSEREARIGKEERGSRLHLEVNWKSHSWGSRFVWTIQHYECCRQTLFCFQLLIPSLLKGSHDVQATQGRPRSAPVSTIETEALELALPKNSLCPCGRMGLSTQNQAGQVLLSEGKDSMPFNTAVM